MKAAILLTGALIMTALDSKTEPRNDAILGMQPAPIKRACQEYCPDKIYQILRIIEHQKTKPYTYTVIFINNNGMIQGKKIDDDLTSELPQYKLELRADGQIIEEERHLISMLAAPKAVRIAYHKWNPKGLKGMTVAWGAEKPRNKERLFSASIVFNQIDGSVAVFTEDGTLVKEKSDPAPVEPGKRR